MLGTCVNRTVVPRRRDGIALTEGSEQIADCSLQIVLHVGGQNVQIAKCRLQNADCTIAEGEGGGRNLAIKGRRLWKPVEGVGEGTAECRFPRPVQIFVRESDCRLQIVRALSL